MIPTLTTFASLPELVLSVFGIIVMLVDPLLAEHNDRKAAGRHRARRHMLAALAATVYQAQLPRASPSAAWSAWTPSASSSTCCRADRRCRHPGVVRVPERAAHPRTANTTR